MKDVKPAALALKLELEIETQPDAKGLRAPFKLLKQKQVNAIMMSSARVFFSPKESGSSSLLANTGWPAVYFRRSLSMRAASCRMQGRTTLTSIGARLFTWTRF